MLHSDYNRHSIYRIYQYSYPKSILLNHNCCLSVVKIRCIGMLSPTQLLYIVFG